MSLTAAGRLFHARDAAWICATFELNFIKYTNKTQYVTLSNALVFYYCELKLGLIDHSDHYGLGPRLSDIKAMKHTHNSLTTKLQTITKPGIIELHKSSKQAAV